MNPEDPIAQALDAEYTEGLSDPSRAAAIMKMLPRLLGSEPNIQQYSGLPTTGQESLADLGALAGQGPSGIPGDSQMHTNLGQVYANRAGLRQRGDIAQQGLEGQRADRVLNLLTLMSKSGPQAKNPFGSVDPTKFTPESIAEFQRTGDYSRLVQVDAGPGQLQPLPGVPGVFFRKGVTGQPEMVNAAGQALTTEQVQQMELAARKAGASNVSVGLQSAIPVTDPNSGETRLIQPSNRPGVPPQVLTLGGKPVAPAARREEPSDAQRMASGYADRMIAAESIIERVGEKGFPTYGTQAAGAIPGLGRYAQSEMMSSDQQMVRQAQEDWVRAKLRKESGAVIAADEMRDEVRTYFPAPGDKPATLKQKGDARRIATEAMMQQGGRARKLPRQVMPEGLTGSTPAPDMEVIDFNSLNR